MDTRLGVVGLVLLTAVLYSPLRSAPFVYEDANDLQVLSSPHPMVWHVPGRPLAMASLELTRSAEAAHLGNVAIHLANGVLVYALGALLVTPLAGLCAAAVFLLHPINSEAVAYVVARTDLLLTCFALLATWAGLTWADRGGWGRFVLIVVGLVGAALSKEMGLIAVPLLVGSLLVWRADRPVVPWVLNGLYAGTGLVVGVIWQQIATWIAVPPGSGGSVFSWPDFAAWQLTALGRLLTLVAWPWGFSVDHDVLMYAAWRGVAVAGALAACGLLVVAWRRWPLLAWALGWSAICVAPRVLFRTNEFIAEHQFYPAMVGVALLIGAAAASWMTAPRGRRVIWL